MVSPDLFLGVCITVATCAAEDITYEFRFDRPMSVSYTHLTLPTIYSV